MAEYISTRQSYYPGTFVLRVINFIIGIIEAMLALRLVLELLGANASSQFVAWVYSVTSGLVAPFSGAFPAIYLGSGLTLDLSTIFAMIGYAVIGWLIVRLVSFLFSTLNASV